MKRFMINARYCRLNSLSYSIIRVLFWSATVQTGALRVSYKNESHLLCSRFDINLELLSL